jgi:hypothetical protein
MVDIAAACRNSMIRRIPRLACSMWSLFPLSELFAVCSQGWLLGVLTDTQVASKQSWLVCNNTRWSCMIMLCWAHCDSHISKGPKGMKSHFVEVRLGSIVLFFWLLAQLPAHYKPKHSSLPHRVPHYSARGSNPNSFR